ncbi:undecaprenyl/decaprenyl-phosphate alpha-N-acetylglucosaminyl 1-phosphate transferase [candidate division KSB1 bacterium]|nr:undecaprenyl/decaprenyl-phosphate alpha-N-acetylglucosaminyl 1-phosphate transferase [candidate division KSB1 bacterium]RQW10699.1 MAG: undecaprenyl/decaprenyl-phosphate alpha-N-acetylglucosaminyl 1-phosphate transferase [candidate division KSB1 bacterium]
MSKVTVFSTSQLILPALLCYVLTVVLAPASIKIANLLNAVDRPGEIKIHSRPTPRLGGLAIFLSVVISVALHPTMTHTLPVNGRMLVGMSSSAIFLVGAIDDSLDLGARTKLLLQIACVLLAVTGLAIFYPGQPLPFIAVFIFILLFTNSFNLIDGMDGLAGSLAMILAFAIGLIASLTHNQAVLFLAILLTSSSTGFLFYNLNPARLFLGDCGSTFIGFSLAILLSMLWLNSGHPSVGLPLVVLAGVPLFDTFFVLLKRKIRHAPLFAGDREHTYDVLLQKGLTIQQTLAIFCAISVFLTSLGVYIYLLLT